jgi:hypothetical protein
MEDESSFEQLEKDQTDQYRIRLREALAIGEKALAAGRILTRAQVKAKMKKWLK